MERGQGDRDKQQPRGSGSSGSGRASGGRCTMKFLTPQNLAAAIIGRGGLVIRDIEKSTNARLGVSKPHEVFPTSDSRVLTACADDPEALDEVVGYVVEKVADIATRTSLEPQVDVSDLKVGVLIPKAFVDNLAQSPEGAKDIAQLCDDNGVTFQIRDPILGGNPDASQELQLAGAKQGLGVVLQELNHRLQAFNGELWFLNWAAWAAGSPTPTKNSAMLEKETNCEVPEEGQAQVAMKVLMPHALAEVLCAAVPAGADSEPKKPGLQDLQGSMAEIEKSCRAKLRLTEMGDFFPKTDSRVLTVQAEGKESLNRVAKRLVAMLNEAAASSRGQPSEGPAQSAASDGQRQRGGVARGAQQAAEGHSEVCWDGLLRLSVLLPQAAAAGLIGRGGSVIKQLIDLTGCHVKVRDDRIGSGPDATQKVDIRGTTEGLEQVLMEVNNQMQALKNEPWFASWASTPMAVAVARAELGTQLSGLGQTGGVAEVGMEMVGRVMDGLPNYVLEESRGFAMTCVVPHRLVGPLMGRGGSGINAVQNMTKTRIMMREIPGDAENRSMTIAGPLLNTCSAYMLMMKRYLDAEKEVMTR